MRFWPSRSKTPIAVLAEASLNRRVRAGDLDGLDPDAVEALLGPKPTHAYDISDQPDWMKAARQWLYEQRMPEFIYPVHGWSAGYFGDVRTPLTWFVCTGCGRQDLGVPWEAPDRDCMECSFSERPFAGWQPAGVGEAQHFTLAAADGSRELFGRVTAPPRP